MTQFEQRYDVKCISMTIDNIRELADAGIISERAARDIFILCEFKRLQGEGLRAKEAIQAISENPVAGYVLSEGTVRNVVYRVKSKFRVEI